MTSAGRPDRARPSKPRTVTVVVYRDALRSMDAVLAAVRAEGCTCKPDVTVNGIHAHVQHDEWCALLRSQDVN